ncbi:TolB family protein [[Eubacterium] cellulosolvens]
MSRLYFAIILISLVVFLSSGFVMVAPAVATKGSYPGTNGKVAFIGNVASSGFSHIFIMNDDGTNIQPITQGDFNVESLCWSPDGTKIAFTGYIGPAGRVVWVINADGTNLRQVSITTDNDYSPAWSPDGKKIAYYRRTGTTNNIYVIDAATTGPGTLLIQVAEAPSWSPDGEKIAFARSGNIYLADSTTGLQIGGALAVGTDPCWSPDGFKIVFVRNAEIWVMNADGSNQQPLTSPVDDLVDEDPNWSPDGMKIIFARRPSSIWIMNADGSNQHDLTPSMVGANEPDYQTILPAPVGGISTPTNKLVIVMPYIALAGLVATISAIIVIKKRKQKRN